MVESSAAEDGSQQWWSVPQAVVWIVARSESQVLRAAGARMLATLERMTGIWPAAGPQEPPVTLTAAPDELRRAWQAGRLAIFGRERGTGPATRVPARPDLWISDWRGEVSIGDVSKYRGTRFWSGLFVRAEDCKRCWQAPAGQAGQAAADLAAPAPPPPIEAKADGAAKVRAIVDAIKADRKQLRRKAFDAMVRALVTPQPDSQALDALWREVTPEEWRKPGQGNPPTGRMVDNWKVYSPRTRT